MASRSTSLLGRCFLLSLLPHLLLLLFLLLLVPSCQAGEAQVRMHAYVLSELCDVSASPIQMVATYRGRAECGVWCVSHMACQGFEYKDDTGCALFGSDLQLERICGPGETVAVRAYIEADNYTAPLLPEGSDQPAGQVQCQNGGIDNGDNTCTCVGGYVGSDCERLMIDCTEGEASGYYKGDQTYLIHPTLAPDPFQVFCFMSTGKGITLIQSRQTQGLSFNRTWLEYKVGFHLNTYDFWLGNDKIHWITAGRPQTMFVQLDDGLENQYYHRDFVMASEAEDYSVTYNSHFGREGSNMSVCWPKTSIPFSTYDRDNDGDSTTNCASKYGAGFWFQSPDCSMCNPNGDVFPSQNVRQDVSNENFWTPNLGSFSPEKVKMLLVHGL